MSMRTVAAYLGWSVMVVIAATTPVIAQDAAEVTPEVNEAHQASTTPPEPTTAIASAQELYDQAFAALANNDRDTATRLLHTLIETYPGDPLSTKAQPLLSALTAAQPVQRAELLTIEPPASTTPQDWTTGAAEARAAPPTSQESAEEAATSMARAEVIFFQTIHGAALGLELCVMAECRDAQPFVGAMMLGAGFGFGGSYLMAQDGVPPGLARALTNGVLWGMVHGIELYSSTGLSDHDFDSTALAATLAVGQIGGMALAGVMHQAWHPTAGQVSLTSSGGIWANVITGHLLGAIQPDTNSDSLGWLLMATGDAGLLAGGLLARAEPMSTSRVLMIDAGGVLGTLAGLGIGVIVASDRFDEEDARVMFSLGLFGTLGGLVSSYLLTDTWDRSKETEAGTTPHLALTPTRDGASLSMMGAW